MQKLCHFSFSLLGLGLFGCNPHRHLGLVCSPRLQAEQANDGECLQLASGGSAECRIIQVPAEGTICKLLDATLTNACEGSLPETMQPYYGIFSFADPAQAPKSAKALLVDEGQGKICQAQFYW